ncbi:MAG: acyl-CoA carboxylase subunit epsilon [Sciscionella sp.]
MSEEVGERARRALLRVVRGNPDDAEVAALAAVVAGMSVAEAAEQPSRAGRSLWADRAVQPRLPHPGPGAWRASSLPS